MAWGSSMQANKAVKPGWFFYAADPEPLRRVVWLFTGDDLISVWNGRPDLLTRGGTSGVGSGSVPRSDAPAAVRNALPAELRTRIWALPGFTGVLEAFREIRVLKLFLQIAVEIGLLHCSVIIRSPGCSGRCSRGS